MERKWVRGVVSASRPEDRWARPSPREASARAKEFRPCLHATSGLPVRQVRHPKADQQSFGARFVIKKGGHVAVAGARQLGAELELCRSRKLQRLLQRG